MASSTKKSTTAPVSYDSGSVAALNAARESAVKAGKDPYGGNLKNYSTFSSSYTPVSSGGSSGSGSSSKIDVITDPVTGNSYSRDTSVAGSTYAPYTKEAATAKKASVLGGNIGSSTAGAGVVSSSDPVSTKEKQTKLTVKGLSVPSTAEAQARKASSDYMKTLDDYSKYLQERVEKRTKSIEDDYAGQSSDLKDKQAREYGSFNADLTRVGGYLGTQISGVGALQNLAKTHSAQMGALEVKKQSAIQEAEDAINDKLFAVAESKAKEAKDIAKTINDMRQQFFSNSLALIQEQRQQEEHEWTMQTQKSDRYAITVSETIKGMDDEQAAAYLQGAAKDLGVDPNILAASVNKIQYDEAQKIEEAVLTLSSKYPSAGVAPGDDWVTAQAKVRSSKEYSLDIRKSEMEIANIADSMRSRRAADARAASESDTSWSKDARIIAYQQTTGKLVTSKAEAKAIMGYSSSLLGSKEIVPDGTPLPAMTPNRVTESDAKKLLGDGFSVFAKDKSSEVPDDEVWRWMESGEAQGMGDDAKASTLRGTFGKNPADFGIYSGPVKF